MAKFIDLTGKRFGRLLVIERAENYIQPNGGMVTRWKCKCDCGKTKIVNTASLKRGKTKSCGCLVAEKCRETMTKHGRTNSRLYGIWKNMRERCNNPNRERYKDWGGRGIRICDEWNDFKTFYEWGMSNGYDETAPRGKCTLDRINNDGNYEPGNCRWANMVEQNRNQRLDSRNESGCAGVYWDKRNKRWAARISISLGDFKNVNDAVVARKAAEEKYYSLMSK
jgi:hypothetical protein